MKATICDRCGEVIKKEKENDTATSGLHKFMMGMRADIADESFDLCEECKLDFKEVFLKKKNIELFKAHRRIKK